MGKKKARYYHDQLSIEPSWMESRKGAGTDALERYLRDAIEKITDALNAASAAGEIDRLVDRYLAGDTWIMKDTQQARDVYKRILPDAVLPKSCTRRWLDIASSRAKDILKEEATKKKTSELVEGNPDLSDGEIAKLFYAEKKAKRIPRGVRVPKGHEVARIRSATKKLDGDPWISTPSFSPKLPLSKADQISEVARMEGGFVLRITPDGASRKSEYFYKMPNSERYATGKVCKPDILIDDAGKLRLVFAIRHKAPTPYEPQCDVPVDVGVLLPFTACAMSKDARSQVVYPNAEIMDEVGRLNALASQKSNLLDKARENEREGRSARLHALAEEQRAEAADLAACMTRSKERIADLVAHRVVGMAFSLCGRIVLEELSWSVPSHAFFQSLLQENVETLALRCGVPVVRVSAAGTSRDCPQCGDTLNQSQEMNSPVCVPQPREKVQRPTREKRGVECPSCGLRGHHDAVSPYNMGCKSLDCALPSRFVRIRFKDTCWSELPSGWRRAPRDIARPFDFSSQVSVAVVSPGAGDHSCCESPSGEKRSLGSVP